MEGIQRKLVQRCNRSLLKLEVTLRKKLNELLNQIETLWFQKSREEAIRDGDRNTRYYLLSTIIQRRINHIESLQDQEGNWVWDEAGLKNMVRNFLIKLYIGIY